MITRTEISPNFNFQLDETEITDLLRKHGVDDQSIDFLYIRIRTSQSESYGSLGQYNLKEHSIDLYPHLLIKDCMLFLTKIRNLDSEKIFLTPGF